MTQDWISGSIALIQVDQDEATEMAADAPKAEEQAEGRGQLCHSKRSKVRWLANSSGKNLRNRQDVWNGKLCPKWKLWNGYHPKSDKKRSTMTMSGLTVHAILRKACLVHLENVGKNLAATLQSWPVTWCYFTGSKKGKTKKAWACKFRLNFKV